MSYVPTTWIDDASPDVDAAHLTHIEQGIANEEAARVAAVASRQARWNVRVVATLAGGSTFTLTAYDQLEIDCTLGNATINPPGVPAVGDELAIKRADSSGFTCTFVGTLDGTANPGIVYQYGSLLLRWDGTKWIRPDRHTITSLVDYPATTDARYAGGAATATALAAKADAAATSTALAGKAPLASPALTGTPTAPTAAPGTNTAQLATTAFVAAQAGTSAQTTLVTAKGQILAATGNAALAALAPGADGTVVMWDSSTVTGLKAGNVATTALVSSTQVQGTPKRLVQHTSASPGAGKWVWELGGVIFNGTYDSVSYFGYNLGDGGVQIVGGENGLSFNLEADYNTGVVRQMEWYIDYCSADGLTRSRPIMGTINRATNAQAIYMVGPLYINNPAGVNLLQFDSGQCQMSAVAGVTNQFILKAVAGQAAIVSLSGNGTDNVFVFRTFSTTPNAARISLNGTDLNIYKNSNNGNQIAVGNVDDNSAVILADAVNTSGFVKSLVARAKTGQTYSIFEAQDSATNPLWVIGPTGIPQWSAAANQQTTVGAAGAASALPATPTEYLKVKNSAGTSLVVPAYAAT